MNIGETRLVPKPDGTMIRIVRTSRSYIYDLRDGYNEALSRPDIEWYVDGGVLKLGDRRRWSEEHHDKSGSNQERQRREWKSRHGFGEEELL